MHKSILFRVGAGTVLGITVTASTFLISTFLPSAELVTVTQARLLTGIGIAIPFIGVPLAWFLWVKGSKSKVIETNYLVSLIPEFLSDMNDKRGDFTENYVHSAIKTGNLTPLDKMSKELYQYLSGVQLPSKIETIEELQMFLTNIDDFINKPNIELSDYDLARLVANSADTRLPIKNALENDKGYRKVSKSLKSARFALPKETIEEASKSIDYYLLYSRAYWGLDAMVLYVVEAWKDINTMMETAYNIFKDRFQEQMSIYMAKVCKVVG